MTFSLFKYFDAILDGVEQNGLAAQSSLVESGRVFIPNSAPWIADELYVIGFFSIFRYFITIYVQGLIARKTEFKSVCYKYRRYDKSTKSAFY